MVEEQEQRFRARVRVDIEEVTGGAPTKYFKSKPFDYPSMGYSGLIAFEAFLNEAFDEVSKKMMSIGIMNAKDGADLAKILDTKTGK